MHWLIFPLRNETEKSVMNECLTIPQGVSDQFIGHSNDVKVGKKGGLYSSNKSF